MNTDDIKQPVRAWAYRTACCLQREAHMQTQGLSVSYHGVAAVHNVTIDIPRGCITAIVGPSGCGKSTFLSCLNRMTDLMPGCRVEGDVRLDGDDIRSDDTNVITLRRRVGMIFQKPNPFPLSIRENLTFPLKYHGVHDRHECEGKAEGALRRVGLWDEVKDRLDTSALNLSGGQQQRLCLARALALDPEVILLDEPCSALDPIASGVVEDLIASLRSSYTVIIVTHNLSQARRLADDVAMFWLADGSGTLIEHGTAEKIFESPENEITADYVRGARG